MLKMIIATVQKQLADRRRYLRAIAEIESMNQRDLSDIRADPAEMRRQVWKDIYGRS